MKNIRHTLIPCLVIFFCFSTSIWAYKNIGNPYKKEAQTSEFQEAKKCLKSGFSPCPAGEQARQKLEYKILSHDKLMLVILAIIATTTIITCRKPEIAPKPQNTITTFTVILTALISAQYLSFKIDFQTWYFLKDSWLEHNLEELSRNCINGTSISDCILIKNWQQSVKIKIMAIKIASLATIIAASAFTFKLSIALLEINSTEGAK